MSFWPAVKRYPWGRITAKRSDQSSPVSQPQIESMEIDLPRSLDSDQSSPVSEPQTESMEIDPPKSLDSDTIYVESGDNIAGSISSVTSISSEDATPISDKFSASVAPNRKRQQTPEDEDSNQAMAREESSEGTISSSERSSTEDTYSDKIIEEGFLEEAATQRSIFQRQSARRTTTGRIKQRSTPASSPDDATPACSQKLECVSIPALLVPKSQYCEWNHLLPVSDERSALSKILQTKEDEDISLLFHEILLEDFVIYRPGTGTRYPWQMVTLDNIISTREACKYLLNGVLRRSDVTEYIEAVEIDINAISIDGFEDTEIHSVHNKVYLQTVICARWLHQARKCWYRLGKPSEEYRHLHKKFLWVADLTKHVIDYLHWRQSSCNDISMVHLVDFRSKFLASLMEWHGEDTIFQKWLRWYGQTDFRIPINRHREFIFSRAYNLDDHYLNHDLWSDLMVRPTQSQTAGCGSVEDTIVTPYIQHCCQSMPWGHVLKARPMSRAVMAARQVKVKSLGFPPEAVNFSQTRMAGNHPNTALTLETAVESESSIGASAEDALGSFAIVRVRPAERSRRHDSYSYAYIQGIVREKHRTLLKVIFLYVPSETPCLDGYYPRSNELFFSEDCNCSPDCEPVLLKDIVRFVNVNFGAEAGQGEGFFMRQKYVSAKNVICTFRESNLNCLCRRPHPETASPRLEIPRRRLKGLSLFAGCGNFDLGLEASGAVEILAAIDVGEYCLKSYAANRSQGLHGLILESVNPCLSQIFNASSEFPAIGNIEFVVAGCPCQGFSRVNPDRGTDKSLRNCSLVASTLSYIETYLPEYALIENVEAMGAGVKNSGNQAIACLVGLGYQVTRLMLKCCMFCSSQSRKRLFILAAAPNLPLPEGPVESDAPQVKASAVSEGLPEVSNEDLICIPYPDHVPGAKQTPILAQLIRNVPRYPKCMNFVKSVQGGFQSEPQLHFFRKRDCFRVEKYHTAFTRLDPDGFIPTITTAARPTCGRGGGKILHWEQHRTLTVLEARRAQGFPDSDVIIGDPGQQWAQIGNAVNRQVAVALGKVIADSWFSGAYQALPEIVVDIPVRKNPEDQAASSNASTLSPLVHPRTSFITQRLKWDSNYGYHTSTEPTNNKKYLVSQKSVREDSDEDVFYPSPDSTRHISNKEPATTTVSAFRNKTADDQILDRLGTKKFNKDEVEFLKEILRSQKSAATICEADKLKQSSENDAEFVEEIIRPQQRPAPIKCDDKVPSTRHTNPEMLSVSQIQRREISALQRHSAGLKVPVKVISERSFEFRTKTPTSPEASRYGTAGNPIDLETELSVSKRRREEHCDEENDEDADLRSWAGKRIRANLND